VVIYIYKTGTPDEIQTQSQLKTERPRHERAAASVIAQQYSSVTFVSFFFHSRQKKNGKRFKKTYFLNFLTLFF